MSQHEAPRRPSDDPPAFADCEPTAWLSGQLATSTVRRIRVSSLNLDFTLRQGRVNIEHVQILAGITEELPPIVVHGPSGRVLDGIHRVHAALAQERSHISAIEYSGSDEDAFAVAVRLNTAHGLPLSRAERIAAAQRILRTHPRWSNRMIAGVTGLAESTVRVRRRDLPEPEPGLRSCTRVGRDGRVRPVNATEGRLRASRLLAERPSASAREIARQAGVSPNTVLDVRRRLAEGREPVPVQARGGEAGAPAVPRPTGPSDLEKLTTAVLAALMADPSIRLNDRGRFLIRWMRANREALTTRSDVACAIPDHWSVPVARLARAYSLFWQDLARQLEHRSAEPPARSADPVLGPPGRP
ncbi:streptomycin biosynthesis regulator [Streptomyces sp. NBC_01477]|uniref:streptomycin biosynthesis regulator n=1 Tax=Streptomyces sp. NBC_01477 TaxID=2976015 RepID=UPI002E32C3AD|nr:streptomycin biosynthesis regulator [Streptomyces sp. NBC_01477]